MNIQVLKNRRIIAVLLALAVVILIIALLYGRITKPTITVTTPDDGYVKILKYNVPLGDINEPIKESYQKASAAVSPGKYEISAYNKPSTTIRVVEVKPNENLSVELELKEIEDLEPVYGGEATSPVIGKSAVVFLDSAGFLSKITAAGKTELLDSSLNYESVSWLNSSEGVAKENNGDLYLVNSTSGTIRKLALPFKNSPDTRLSYTVSGKDLYVSNGENVFKGDLNGKYEKIYMTGRDGIDLYAGPKNVAIAEIDINNEGNKNPALVIAGNSSQNIKKDLPLDSISWSPDGNYLVNSSGGKSIILNSSLEEVAYLPGDSLASILWLDNDNLYYGTLNELWSYNLTTETAYKISNVYGEITATYLDSGSSYIYIAAKRNGQSKLFRYSLNGQQNNETAQALHVALPEAIGACNINYINITEPIITVEYPRSRFNQDGSSGGCLQAAKSTLEDYGLDPENYKYSATIKE